MVPEVAGSSPVFHPKIYVIQTRCRSGLQNLDGGVRFLDGVLKVKIEKLKEMKTKLKYKR